MNTEDSMNLSQKIYVNEHALSQRFNINMEVSYNNNEQYRATLRRMFYMDLSMCALALESQQYQPETQENYNSFSSRIPITEKGKELEFPEGAGGGKGEPGVPPIDEETRDEMMYDERTVSKIMDELLEVTISHPLFQYLYDAAAGKMLSTNREIGQAVLFSYDYLPLFHKCLASFVRSPADFTETNQYYVALSKKIV